MTNWYCGGTAVKRAADIHGTSRDTIIDRLTEASSRIIRRSVKFTLLCGEGNFDVPAQPRLCNFPKTSSPGW